MTTDDRPFAATQGRRPTTDNRRVENQESRTDDWVFDQHRVISQFSIHRLCSGQVLNSQFSAVVKTLAPIGAWLAREGAELLGRVREPGLWAALLAGLLLWSL